MMEEKKASLLFEEFRDEVIGYVRNTVELSKLQVYEKTGLGIGSITYFILLNSLITLALTLFFVTLGLFLGELLQNMWAGFGISTALVILIILILVLIKKSLKSSIANKAITFLMEEDKDKKD